MRQSYRTSRILRPQKTFFSYCDRLGPGETGAIDLICPSLCARARRLSILVLFLTIFVPLMIDSADAQGPNSNGLARETGQNGPPGRALPLELGQPITRE